MPFCKDLELTSLKSLARRCGKCATAGRLEDEKGNVTEVRNASWGLCAESTQMVVSNICWYSPRNLGKMNPIWRACFSNGLVQPPTRYSKGPWKWTCQHDHIFEGSLVFPYHPAMGMDLLNFQGSFGAGDWCWFLMKKTGSVVKYLISELGSYIYIIYIHITYDEYISIWILFARTYTYTSWDYVLCLWLYS